MRPYFTNAFGYGGRWMQLSRGGGGCEERDTKNKEKKFLAERQEELLS